MLCYLHRGIICSVGMICHWQRSLNTIFLASICLDATYLSDLILKRCVSVVLCVLIHLLKDWPKSVCAKSSCRGLA